MLKTGTASYLHWLDLWRVLDFWCLNLLHLETRKTVSFNQCWKAGSLASSTTRLVAEQGRFRPDLAARTTLPSSCYCEAGGFRLGC